MFERPHHQRIAQILGALNAPLLREHQCLFGGGTAIVLRRDEFRESVDIDFLVSDLPCYRGLRQLLANQDDINPILREDAEPIAVANGVRADQYGIRCKLLAGGEIVKFEIVLEGRIELSKPGLTDEVCGVATLTLPDMAASKLLANSDRWRDDGAFSRDLVDLAMLDLPLKQLRRAIAKAENAYGHSIIRDLGKAIGNLQAREGWLERCMQALQIDVPKALLWQKIRVLQRVVAGESGPGR